MMFSWIFYFYTVEATNNNLLDPWCLDFAFFTNNISNSTSDLPTAVYLLAKDRNNYQKQSTF